MMKFLDLEKLRETFAKNTTLITQDGEEVDILGAKLNSLVNENESINKSINDLRVVIDNDQCSENSLLEFNDLLKAKKDNEKEISSFLEEEYYPEIKSKNRYADALIFNSKGELLMLFRTAKDGNKELDNKWGLPGGHIDDGETPEQAVIREVVEETNLNIEDCKLLDTIGKCNYFLCFANTDNLILNAIEHTNLKWVNSDELETLDCIYDLKDRLRKYFKDYQTNFNLIVDKTINNPFDALEIVKSAFDNGQISEEKYLEYLEKANHVIDIKISINDNEIKKEIIQNKEEVVINDEAKKINIVPTLLSEYLTNLINTTDDIDQKSFYQWQLENSNEVKITSIDTIKKEYPSIEEYLQKNSALMKQSYSNAANISISNKNILYIEGYVCLNGIVMPYAFNKINGLYFDITRDFSDITLKDNSKDIVEYYVSIIELNNDEVLKYALETESYNSYLLNVYKDKNSIQKSKDIDTVILDVPLFIRLLEYAKEDAKSDLDLHKLTENVTNLCKDKNMLVMDDYEKLTNVKIEKSESTVKIGDTKKWHGRNFKYTSSGWSYDDHEKNSSLKTEKGKQKLKIQDFNDDDLNLHAKRTPEKHLKKIVSEGSNPKLREIAQKELNTRAKRNEEHNLYSLMILEEADRDETGDEIHFEEGKHPDDETLNHLTKLGVKHKIVKKE